MAHLLRVGLYRGLVRKALRPIEPGLLGAHARPSGCDVLVQHRTDVAVGDSAANHAPIEHERAARALIEPPRELPRYFQRRGAQVIERVGEVG